MTEASAFRPKKSVALSGVTAGNTALCTVGRTGNDLHYRGYDILEIANVCEFDEIADRLIACLGSMLTYWYHFSRAGKRIRVETEDDSVGAHFLHLLHGKSAPASWVRAMHTSLILYAEHEFNASTFAARVIAGTGADVYSCITGALG